MIRGLLLDLEGVLYEGERGVAGAVEAVAELERRGLSFRYLTNTTTRPRRAIAARLTDMGFAMYPAHLFTPPAAAGLRAVQVKTGKYRPRDDDHGSVIPDGRIASIADLPRWLQDHGDIG